MGKTVKWILGICAFGGLIIVIVLFTLFWQVKDTIFELRNLQDAREELIALHGEVVDFVPPPSGVMAAKRLDAFLAVRDALAENRASLLAELDDFPPEEVTDGEVESFGAVMKVLEGLGELLVPIIRFLHERDRAREKAAATQFSLLPGDTAPERADRIPVPGRSPLFRVCFEKPAPLHGAESRRLDRCRERGQVPRGRVSVLLAKERSPGIDNGEGPIGQNEDVPCRDMAKTDSPCVHAGQKNRGTVHEIDRTGRDAPEMIVEFHRTGGSEQYNESPRSAIGRGDRTVCGRLGHTHTLPAETREGSKRLLDPALGSIRPGRAMQARVRGPSIGKSLQIPERATRPRAERSGAAKIDDLLGRDEPGLREKGLGSIQKGDFELLSHASIRAQAADRPTR